MQPVNKQLGIWRFVAENLREKIPVTILYVLESKGSSPGRQGFCMAVNAKGNMQGSIGGGIMEHKFVEMAKGRMQAASVELQVKKQVHDGSATRDRSGMICSGEQTVLIYPAQEQDVLHINNIIASLGQNKNGTLELSPAGILFSESLPEQDFYFQIKSEEDWQYSEKTGYKNQLFIIGGGHCALALSKLMGDMDFFIHLFEERKDLNTVLQNEAAHQKKILAGYEELKELVPSGHRHYVVIMTFGYRTDDIALRALLHKDFKYLGLLGSKKKIKEMFAALQQEGVADEILSVVHAPVGLDIKSQTPEEIAVSIAAEIIKIKNA